MSDQPETRYQVLARKYRPETFADLVGQEAMVRTLKNAFAASRIAQAFIMTGIRGTGKTTTARIIAKGLNCIGPDGTGKSLFALHLTSDYRSRTGEYAGAGGPPKVVYASTDLSVNLKCEPAAVGAELVAVKRGGDFT